MTAAEHSVTADLVAHPKPVAAPAPSLRAVKDHNGIYHSNEGRPLMWVVFWVAVVAWIVLVGGIAAAAVMS